MNFEYTVQLPWPPSVNHYKKVGGIIKTKSGKLYQKRVNTDQTKKFYFDVYILTKQSMPREWAKYADSDVISFDLRVYLYPPNSCRYDIDNAVKSGFDSLTRAHVIKDDSQTTDFGMRSAISIENGKVVVRYSGDSQMTLNAEQMRKKSIAQDVAATCPLRLATAWRRSANTQPAWSSAIEAAGRRVNAAPQKKTPVF